MVETLTDLHIQQKPFPRLTFQEAMDRFGSDKPDLRFGLELRDLSDIFAWTEFGVFAQTLESGGQIKGICVPGSCRTFSRVRSTTLTAEARTYGARGLVTSWLPARRHGALLGGASPHTTVR